MDPENQNPLTNISLYVGLVVVLIFALSIYGVFKLYQKRVAGQTATLITPTIQTLASPSPTPSLTHTQVATTTNPPQTLPASGSDTVEIKNIGIFVSVPKNGQIVNSPIFVSGTANVTSQIVIIRVKNSIGDILGQGQAKACLDTDACPFEVSVSFTKAITQTGTVETYSQNVVNGQEEYLQSIPVSFSN